ncbi:outer membrane protein assembly factor BamC [Candidiatus Paracoxiella cheracis]|uniref:outer membrane protein assembly factor BamC n=1 Tax=Candidiatus Paracoxiella cheracis TaxID=3405120 RepID=UPI003BF4DAC7
MRYLIYLFSGVMALLLVGCANHNKDYIKQSKTVHTIVVPRGVALKPAQNYYPVPASTPQNISTSPSLVPPGSDLQRFNPKSQAKSQPQKTQTLATLTQTKNGQVLEVSEQSSVAWARVGKALRKTSYKVLDEDPSMASYYVLDATSTNNKITKSTPIYRVLLKTNGDNTQVELLNQQNQPAPVDVSKRILGALQKNLV